jgi:hypothetical protein
MNKKNCRNLEERITSIEERLETVNQSNASTEVKEREIRKIKKNTHIQLLLDILYDKKTKCVRREAVAREAIARAREASELSHRRSRSRSPTRNKTSKSRSRSPTRNKTHKSRSRSPRYKND